MLLCKEQTLDITQFHYDKLVTMCITSETRNNISQQQPQLSSQQHPSQDPTSILGLSWALLDLRRNARVLRLGSRRTLDSASDSRILQLSNELAKIESACNEHSAAIVTVGPRVLRQFLHPIAFKSKLELGTSFDAYFDLLHEAKSFNLDLGAESTSNRKHFMNDTNFDQFACSNCSNLSPSTWQATGPDNETELKHGSTSSSSSSSLSLSTSLSSSSSSLSFECETNNNNHQIAKHNDNDSESQVNDHKQPQDARSLRLLAKMNALVKRLHHQGHKFVRPNRIKRRAEIGLCEQLAANDLEEHTVVRTRGLLWQANEQDLADFFVGLDIAKGGVALCLSPAGRRNGEALVRFESQELRKMALKRHKHFMGSRYIEVYGAPSSEFARVASACNPKAASFLSRGAQVIVRMRGLPFACTAKQVVDFFADNSNIKTINKHSPGNIENTASADNQPTEANKCQVMHDEAGVLFVKNADGKPTGDAFVLFACEQHALIGLQKHKQNIGNRYIELFKSSTSEVQQVVNMSLCASAPIPSATSTSASSCVNKETNEYTQCSANNKTTTTAKRNQPNKRTSLNNQQLQQNDFTYAQAAIKQFQGQQQYDSQSLPNNNTTQQQADPAIDPTQDEHLATPSKANSQAPSPASSSTSAPTSANSLSPTRQSLTSSSASNEWPSVASNSSSGYKTSNESQQSASNSCHTQNTQTTPNNQTQTDLKQHQQHQYQHQQYFNHQPMYAYSYSQPLQPASPYMQPPGQPLVYATQASQLAAHHHHQQQQQQQMYHHPAGFIYAPHYYRPPLPMHHYNHNQSRRAPTTSYHPTYDSNSYVTAPATDPSSKNQNSSFEYTNYVAASCSSNELPESQRATLSYMAHEPAMANASSCQTTPAPPTTTTKDCVRLRGLPYEANVEHVLDFLSDHSANIAYQGIHLVYSAQGYPSGEAFVQMDCEESVQQVAQKYHCKEMSVGKKQRYIEVIPCSMHELIMTGGFSMPHTTHYNRSHHAQPHYQHNDHNYIHHNGSNHHQHQHHRQHQQSHYQQPVQQWMQPAPQPQPQTEPMPQ